MKRIFLIIAAFWLVLFIGFIGTREHTLRTGREVRLKTAPVDPRDLFRGDYVILSYEISTIDLSQMGAREQDFSKGKTIYVLIDTIGDYGVAKGVQVSPPAQDELFLKGRVLSIHGQRVNVEYGIESYFVPESAGKPLERARRDALDVIAAVDRRGNAVIKTVLLEGEPVRFPN